MADPLTTNLADEAGTERLGAWLFAALRRAGIDTATVLLRGDLGAGKTCLARGFLRAAGHGGAVPSPTYTLVEPYDVAGLRVFHLDLYRLADAGELEYLGWRDLRPGILLVEWPERAPDVERDADLEIELRVSGDGRRAVISGLSDAGEGLVAALGDAIDAA
jgi:tRNA threonylcarbamoyladenosine biosynthesis protein TsaE